MAQLSRITTFANGTIIDADTLNDEFDQCINGHNDNDTRLTAIESGNLTISGNKTFNGTISLGSTLSVTGTSTLTGAVTLGSTLTVSGATTLTGNVTLGVATPTLAAHAASKQYVDNKFGAGLLNFNATSAPVYGNSTQFSVANISCRNSDNTDTISKTTATTVDISTSGLNGIAQSGSSRLLGTVSVTASNNVITGNGTSFLTDFQVGDVINITGSEARRITSISSNTSMTAESNFVTTATNANYYRGGRAPNTFYNLYAISDGTTSGLLLSTRNVVGGDTLSDRPGSISTIQSMDATTDVITTTSNHNLKAGLAVKFQDSGSGSLPSGLAFGTTYYASVVSTTTFKIHTTQADALAGTNTIDITADKSGTVVVLYESYSNIRQLPFCIKTDSGTTSPVIQPFLVSHGWPSRPLIIYNTEYDEVTFANTTTSILSGGLSTSFADVSAINWIPPVSRQSLIWFWAANNVRISLKAKNSPSSSGVPTLVTGASYSQERLIDTDSSRTIQYKTSSGSYAVNLAVRGFVITEVN